MSAVSGRAAAVYCTVAGSITGSRLPVCWTATGPNPQLTQIVGLAAELVGKFFSLILDFLKVQYFLLENINLSNV